MSLRLLARNDRDGSINIERSGVAASAGGFTGDQQPLIVAGPWLDVVQVELDPDRIEILEARVFDHETRQLITEDSGLGWRVVQPNVVQLYGFGRHLPERVDVWLRLNSYPNGPPATLAPQQGERCPFAGGSITLEGVRAGRWNYSERQGFHSQFSNDDTTIVLSWQGEADGRDYQAVAVTKSNDRIHTNVPHYLRFGETSFPKVLHFDLSFDDLDHLELRSFGGRHRFFFDGLTLPRVSQRPFNAPPVAIVNVTGQPIAERIADFAPLDVRIEIDRGEWVSQVRSGNPLHPPRIIRFGGQAPEQDSAFTLGYLVRGIGYPARSSPAATFRFLDKRQGRFVMPQSLGPWRAITYGGAGNGVFTMETPLEHIDAVEVTLNPGP